MALRPALVFAVVALASTRAGAPPPLSPFPDVVVPPGLSSAPFVPANAQLWIFGDGAPDAAAVGISVTVDGAVVDGGERARSGCCLITAAPPWRAGARVHVLVATAGAEREVDFVTGDVIDETPPTLDDVAVLDDSGGALVLGVGGADDTALAGFLAKDDTGSVLSAAPEHRVLVVPLPDGATCVDVVAVDLAAHASPVRRACKRGGEGEGDGDGGGDGDGDQRSGGCATANGASASSLAAALAVGSRRRRRVR